MKHVFTQAIVTSFLAAVVLVLVMQARFFVTSHRAILPTWIEELILVVMSIVVVAGAQLTHRKLQFGEPSRLLPMVGIGMLASALLAVMIGVGYFVYARFLNPDYAHAMIASATIPSSISSAADSEAFRIGLELQFDPTSGALLNAVFVFLCGALASAVVAFGARLLPNARLTSRSS